MKIKKKKNFFWGGVGGRGLVGGGGRGKGSDWGGGGSGWM